MQVSFLGNRASARGPLAAVGVLCAHLHLGPAVAHEFWLDPVTFEPKVGAAVPVVLRNGMNFLGDSYPYQRRWARRFSAFDARGERPVRGVEGDDPAAEVRIRAAGLTIVAFERAQDAVDYPTADAFLETLDDEGLDDVAAKVRSVTTRPVRFKERYVRFAKTLLSVDGSGQDRAVGLGLELVLDGSPADARAGAPVRVRLLRNGQPVGGAQVKMFSGPDDKAPVRARTAADGTVELNGVRLGEVLLSAVVMQPTSAGQPQDAAVPLDWTSVWASLTFKVR